MARQWMWHFFYSFSKRVRKNKRNLDQCYIYISEINIHFRGPFVLLPCLDTFHNTTEVFLSWERRKQSLILFASNCQLTYQLRAKCYIYTFQNGLFTNAHLISLLCLLSEGSSYSSDCFLKKSVNPFSFNVGKVNKGLYAFISKN